MRTLLALTAAGVLTACATTSPFPEASGGPVTAAELAHSFDSAVQSRLLIFTRADRACTLDRAAELSQAAGEPTGEGSAASGIRVFTEGSGGGLNRVPDVSAREMAAARLVREAAIECQQGSN
jgi:hypothetical protein